MRALRTIAALRTIGLAGGALLALATTAWAQANYPSQLVRIVVPFGAGSITDSLARILADKLSDAWKQQVVVENRPGLVGTTVVAKSAPDGYTLMLTSNGHTISGVINKNIQFDPVKDFAGVTKMASVPLVAIVPPSAEFKSLPEFIAQAKAQPGKLNFSSAGVASTSYLSAEMLRQAAKIDILHVPYKGVPDAVTAVIRGDAQLYFAPIPNAQEMAVANKARAIAINSTTRNRKMPDIASVAETVPGYSYESWFAFMVPTGTPRPIIMKLNEEIARILKMPDVIEKLDAMGAVASPTTPEALDDQLKRETELYAKVLRAAGLGAN